MRYRTLTAIVWTGLSGCAALPPTATSVGVVDIKDGDTFDSASLTGEIDGQGCVVGMGCGPTAVHIAGTDASIVVDPCQVSGDCHWLGFPLCTCGPMADVDCANSDWCKTQYWCGVFHHQCTAVARLGCDGPICSERGQCLGLANLCAATEQTCLASSYCALVGACHVCTSPGGQCPVVGEPADTTMVICQPNSQADCAQSVSCAQNKHGCTYNQAIHWCMDAP